MAQDAPTQSSRDKILDVAEAAFARRGFAGVGLREVAESAGLGKSSLFHHFPSKAEIYLAVLGRVLERIAERLTPIFEAAGDPAERLDRALDAWIDALAEHPTSARLLLRSLFEEDDLPETAEIAEAAAAVDRVLESVLGRMLALLREGVEAGDFRRVSARHTLQTLIGASVFHFASGAFGEQVFEGPLFSAEAVRRRKQEVKSLIHSGLLAPGTAPSGGTS